MPEATTAGDSQVETDAETQVVEPQTTDKADTQAVDAEELVPKTKLQKVQNEAKNLRERLKKYEEAETALLPENEKLNKQLQQVTAERDALRAEARAAKVQSAATKAGALYPDAVARLIPEDAEDFDAAVREIRKQYPAMFKSTSVDGGAGTSGRQTADMNTFIRQMAGRK